MYQISARGHIFPLFVQYSIFSGVRQEKKGGAGAVHSAKQAIRSTRGSIWRKVIRGTSSPASKGSSAKTSSPEVTVSVPSRSPTATGACTEDSSVTD